MICDRARGLFGACWDDELTQAEREWLETHFASCARCRAEYDDFSRALELTGSLPRVEASPDLAERVLARARRASAAPDRVAEGGLRWVPAVTAAAVSLLVVGALLFLPGSPLRSPGGGERARMASRPEASAPALPGLRQGVAVERSPVATRLPERRGPQSGASVAIPDSLFDHGEDVDFVLDPVAIHRGRASVARVNPRVTGVQGQQALITF